MNQSVVLSSKKCGIKKWFPLKYKQTKEYNSSLPQPQIIVPEGCVWGEDEKLYTWNESILINNFQIIRNYKPFVISDCVVCMYLPSTCQNYVAFNKTTLFIPGHRFFLKKCSRDAYDMLFRVMFTNFPNVVIAASGIYEYEHIRYFTGKSVPIIHSSSLFGFEQPQSYMPTRTEYLVAPFKKPDVPFEKELIQYCKQYNHSNCQFTTMLKENKRGWDFKLLFQFKAVIVFPYATLSYFLNDLYTACIPMFVPSPSFLVKLRIMTRVQAKKFCKPGSSIHFDFKTNYTNHPYSPEEDSEEAKTYWFYYSTFYSPATTVFNSWEDLFSKLEKADYQNLFLRRKEENERIIKHNINEWEKVFGMIEKDRRIPKTYEEAREYFNVDRFIL